MLENIPDWSGLIPFVEESNLQNNMKNLLPSTVYTLNSSFIFQNACIEQFPNEEEIRIKVSLSKIVLICLNI